jgi:hypothetical protein
MVATRHRLALAVALLVAACGPRRPTHVRVDPALAALVPAETTTLAGLRLDRLRPTRFYQKLLSVGPSGGLGRFLEQAGLDPNSDLWEALVAFNGKDAAVMLRGKFSPMGLEPKLERAGAQRIPYRGYTLIGDEQLAVVFLNPSAAVAARAAMVRSILDHRSDSNGIPKPLADRLRAIDPENQLWAVAAGGTALLAGQDAGNWSNFNRLLERIQGLTLAAAVSEGLVLTARGECASAADAETIETALRGLLGLARLGWRGRPALVSLTQTLAVSRQENIVSVHAGVPADLLDALLDEVRSAQ